MATETKKNDPQVTDASSEKSEVPRSLGSFIVYVFKAIMKKKRYWLLPLWCLLLAIALILFLTGNGALLPAIYMAF